MMLLTYFLLLTAAAIIPALSAVFDRSVLPTTHNLSLDTQICGTPPPSDELKQAHAELKANPRGLQSRGSSSPILVQLYMHLVTTMDQASSYSQRTLPGLFNAQVKELNAAYQPSGIQFHLSGTTHTIRDDWATDANSTAMKKALRQGAYQDLNIYFQTNLSSAPYTYSPANTLLGYCTLPTNITYTNAQGGQTEYPVGDYYNDGCNVLARSMPNNPYPMYGYNQGKTAVHEVGHWFGLLHTFQDNTCTPGDAGDYVDDTPQESTATSGCPTGKDSCTNDPGLDPIANFMDYSTDACYTGFSPDQQVRMQGMWARYRKGY